MPATLELAETDERQLRLLISDPPASNQEELRLGVTFQDSRQHGVHRWYPYVEGFSANYLRELLTRHEGNCTNVYDPFGGAGTTQLTASCLGLPSFYSEINPFMAYVAETKVHAASWAKRNWQQFVDVATAFNDELTDETLDDRGSKISLSAYEAAFPGRDFFEERPLRHLLAARELAVELAGDVPEIASLLLLACAANAVHSSNPCRSSRRRRTGYAGSGAQIEAAARCPRIELRSTI